MDPRREFIRFGGKVFELIAAFDQIELDRCLEYAQSIGRHDVAEVIRLLRRMEPFGSEKISMEPPQLLSAADVIYPQLDLRKMMNALSSRELFSSNAAVIRALPSNFDLKTSTRESRSRLVGKIRRKLMMSDSSAYRHLAQAITDQAMSLGRRGFVSNWSRLIRDL